MPSTARSLAEDLRQRTDDQLQYLLRVRPALARPVPKSFADLALRANSSPATIIALDELTRAELDVLEASCALAVGGRFGVADLAAGLAAGEPTVAPIVAELLDRALLWGASDDLRVPSAVREVFGREPGGLDATPRPDLPVVRAALRDPEAFRIELRDAPEPARNAAMTAAWGPAVLPEPGNLVAAAGQDWLAERGLLVRDETGTTILPRELALILRDGLLLREPHLAAPDFAPPDPQTVTDRAGHAADQFVREFDRVVGELTRQPWIRQANGAIAARDWDRALSTLALDPGRLALHVALAIEIGQVALDADDRLRPTTGYQECLTEPVAARWAALAAAWLDLPRAVPAEPSRVLSVRADLLVPTARRLLLTGLAAGAGFDVARWLQWYRPRLHLSTRLLNEVLAEAEALGLCVGAMPAAPTRTLTWPVTADALAADVMPTLPTLTDRIVLQADLTATALGPLEPAVERRLTAVADWESGGAATVFRFTAASVRRGLAAGVDPDEFVSWLAAVAVTAVPQALSVLVADQAGTTTLATVHAAQAVVTCDPEVAAAILADARLTDLHLRSIADGVLVSDQPGEVVAPRLRVAGHTVSTPEGAPIRLTRPEPDTGALPPTSDAPAERIVRSLRQVEHRAHPEEHPPSEVATSGPHAVQQRLHAATARHDRLWLAFADRSGKRLTHLVEPLAVADGDVCAFDVTAGEIRTIPLERIVGYSPASA